MNSRSDNFLNLPSHKTVFESIFLILNLLHNQNRNSSFVEISLDSLHLLTPKIAHYKLRPMLYFFLSQLTQQQCIVFEYEVLHLAELQKNYCFHVSTLNRPIYLKHRTHILKFLFIELQLVWDTIPPPQKIRSNMLSHLFISIPDFKYLRYATFLIILLMFFPFWSGSFLLFGWLLLFA